MSAFRNVPKRIRPYHIDPRPMPTTTELMRAERAALILGDKRRAELYRAIRLDRRLAKTQREARNP